MDRSVIVENGVKLKLNIIDTPGYGDQINNEGCWDPIVKYVGSCFFHDLGPAAEQRRRSKTSTPRT
jgi:septin family protein